ncbi:uncharacterized protein LAJ45_08402 [Morchella importuna]|uniref:uncharacterized protein n=1 Tax=Morchella importuna TaxID=1174673 RepID=UPI001E8CFD7B|nr:uncharacterized protein LAJ45_08402 [Morchella importuna]KAH8147575.1 hypothetical protein LAJ45_08402 [Morchella importuna]
MSDCCPGCPCPTERSPPTSIHKPQIFTIPNRYPVIESGTYLHSIIRKTPIQKYPHKLVRMKRFQGSSHDPQHRGAREKNVEVDR